MKNLFFLSYIILLLSGCENSNAGNIEKRIAELEKSSALKDKQIIGLSYLAYFSALDSSKIAIGRNKAPEKFFKENALARPSKCLEVCNNIYNIKMRKCGKLSPKKRNECETKADLEWNRCTITCRGN